MLDAFALLLRLPSIFAWVALIGTAAGVRVVQTQIYRGLVAENIALLNVIASISSILVNAVLIFVLARTLLIQATGPMRPLFMRGLGLYLLSILAAWAIKFAGTIAMLSQNPSPYVMMYGSSLAGAFGSIVVFPIIVRTFATAAGIEQPRLGFTWAFALNEGRHAYLWYAFCAVLFPVLMVFTFASLLPAGNEANALRGNLIQSVVTGTGDLLRFMLAIVLAQMAALRWHYEAEVFA